MKKLLFNNTYKKGSLTYFAFKENGDFTGVCLELDLVVSGKSLKEVKEKIEDLSHGWVVNIIEKRLPEELLNKPAPLKYWKMFEKALGQTISKVKVELGKKDISISPSASSISTLPYSNNQAFSFGFS